MVAKRYGICEEYLEKLVDYAAIPRILEELDLQTFRSTSMHEANADARDAIQHGVLQLPCKSWTLSFFIAAGADALYLAGKQLKVLSFYRST